VTITDDAADSPQTIALTGAGTVVQVSPSALNFGDQIVGTTSGPSDGDDNEYRQRRFAHLRRWH
jgi:hypothetical protein